MITTPTKKLICKFRASALIGFLSLTFVSSGYSQDNVEGNAQQAAEAASTSAEEQFTLNMREADIQGFIQWVANRTGKNIVIHRSVRGAITILSSRAVSPDEAYELFLTVLSMNGFAAVETDGIIKVIPDAEAKTNAIPFLGDQTRDGSVVISIIDIKNSSSSDLMALARPLMPASAHIASYNQSNTLIIADTARNIAKISKIIAILDQTENKIDLDIIPIIHASADDIASTLSKIVKALDGNAKALAETDKVEFAVDKRSNSILVTGTASKRKQMADLIARLDQPIEGGGNTQVVYLNYIEASEITPILKSVGDSVIKDNKTESTQSFSIESSETTNALIMTGPPGLISNLKSVISQLDIQRAQVLIEAVVVQVSGDAGEDFGVVWGGSEIYDENRSGGVGAVNTPASNADFGALLSAAIPVTGDTPNPAQLAAGVLSNSGLTYGYLESGNLIAALRAVTTRNKSNIMSTPTIVALDNEEASLLVGQSVPFITGSATSSGATTTNPFQTIQRQDIGITLNVTPRINQGDSITLEIEQKTENVSQTANSRAADLITEKTEIKTSALIKDGQVLVLGGLIREDDVNTRTQVPILGDLPLLGRLFRSNSVSKRKNNLMVFIRPVILKDQLQISGLTAQRYAFMREKQMQNALSTFIKLTDNPALADFDEYQTITPQQDSASE
ncbi:type II secretion system secretin GspD [Pseudomonadales bacterium]|nr:type II secretion system secretin GspD [Pseudomonadales bacterium]